MNQIEMALIGNKIAITLWSEDDACSRTRHISLESAVDLSLLLDGGAFPWALNFETAPGVAIQIENLPYKRAWICIAEEFPKTGAGLNACVEGQAVAEVGRLLSDLVVAANGSLIEAKEAAHIRTVEYCYLDDGE